MDSTNFSVRNAPRVCQNGPSSISYNQRGGADFRLESAGLRWGGGGSGGEGQGGGSGGGGVISQFSDK